ncbi:bifunctional metallophosphatase/5'-nucleotidase [Legionella waltersii]|uniref:5'-nucleotidase n=2 Tax=Legionella waltersii TaxID=66969 RepID=A0A0W1ADN2_9GAMM|nr:bifunctional metallophosphatase/5'-nucleotidase [Legionella waltersii]KTD79280.1 5'-nucleotidase [Legionella waltersii]SNV12862.1 5'-nucleotidase [Legionella waltersii]
MFFAIKRFFLFFIFFSTTPFLIPSPISFASITSQNGEKAIVQIKLLGINDFHGQISAGKFVNNEPVGGAAVLAAYLHEAQYGMNESTVITLMGDVVGASPPTSALLNDEPSILFINSLGNQHCKPESRLDPLCNVVATVGNHEFDRGQKAMFELMYGSHKPPKDEWVPLPFYPGAAYPYISANIVDANTHKPLFPPYVIKSVNSIPVAFIGAVLKKAADSMFPANAEGVSFLDEAKSINHYIPEIKAQGVQIIVVLLHEGGNQIPYEGETKKGSPVNGDIQKIVWEIDDGVDVIMGGHTHQFLNAYLPNKNGKEILVTQANSYSAAFAEVTLQVNLKTKSVVEKYARIITTYAKQWPGTNHDEKVLNLVRLAEDKVEPVVNSYIGTTQIDLLKKQNEDGESNLGNLVTDAFKHMMGAEIGLTNPSGMRDDIQAGEIKWGQIFSTLPFNNHTVTVTLTGQDLYDLFEQQWMGSYINMLQISGINYDYDPTKPLGHKIISIHSQNKPIDKNKVYTIATNDFLASGNGVFSVMKRAKMVKVGDIDHETVIAYIKQLPQPFKVGIEGRIKKVMNTPYPLPHG